MDGSGVQVGPLFVSNVLIGTGSNGTVVLEGDLQGVGQVAVKRLLAPGNEEALMEIKTLILLSERLPYTVVRYYYVEHTTEYIYVALERCSFSLYDLIVAQATPERLLNMQRLVNEVRTGQGSEQCCQIQELKLWDNHGRPTKLQDCIVAQILYGLASLHIFGIMHGHLKPHNVLVSVTRESRGGPIMKAKIAGMGQSKHVSHDAIFWDNSAGSERRGWQAPEQLQEGRLSEAGDVFNFGCLLFYCLSGGRHPFGRPECQDQNILDGKIQWTHMADYATLVKDHIRFILHPESESRPTVVHCSKSRPPELYMATAIIMDYSRSNRAVKDQYIANDTSVANDNHLDVSRARESAQLVTLPFRGMPFNLGNSRYNIDTSVANDNHLDVSRESAQLVPPGFLSLGMPLGNSRYNIDTSIASVANENHIDVSRESAQLVTVPSGFLSLGLSLGNLRYNIDTSVANDNHLEVSRINAHHVHVPGAQDLPCIVYTGDQSDSAGNPKVSLSSIQDHLRKCSCRRINDIFVSNVVIGYGSDGTTVREGHMGFRKVAVKLVLVHFYEKVDREIQLLIESDGHPNVVKYYNVAQDLQFIYLALERCSFSLYDLICAQTLEDQDIETRKRLVLKGLKPCSEEEFKLWDGRRPSAQLFQIMRDIVNGLVHLHVLGIVHRDLKPHNVLISRGQSMRAKIADMGLSKLLHSDEVSFSNTTGPGTRGWQAPEQLQKDRGSSKMDIFALGCVLYYCVSKGKHPFGSHYERDANIVQAKMDLSDIAVDNPEAADLIECLLDPDPRKRPSAHGILVHPFFWDAQKSLSFLKDASNRVKFDKEQSTSFLPEDVKSTRPSVSYSPWKGKLDVPLVDYIQNHGSYDFNTIGDLLRAIRNLDAHFTEVPEPLQVILGRGSNGLYEYFRSRYPRLLIEIYHVIGYHYKAHPTFAPYFLASFESKFVPYR